MDDEKLYLLCDLIRKNILDIKIAVTDQCGIYHDKLGILEDFDNNQLVFYGSPNSSYSGYRSNYEKIRISKGWENGGHEIVNEEIEEFDSLWNNTNEFVEVYEYQKTAEKKLIEIIETRNNRKNQNEIVLRDYQKQAIQAWIDNDYRGFFVMATGTGKTWTAIFAAKELIKKQPALITICAPYKHLVKQWSEDVILAFPKADIVMVSSENPKWDIQLTDAIVKSKYDNTSQVIVISTIASFKNKLVNIILKYLGNRLLIVDEAHRFTNHPEALKKIFPYMLGLSATPFSGKNTANGLALMDFFGGQVFILSIEDALEKGYLVPYYYYPIFINATEDEEQRFNRESAQIASCFKNGVCIDKDKLAVHLRARLRVISMAEEKIDRILELLKNIKEKDHFIIYCGDGRLHDNDNEEIRHIEFVKQNLSSLGFKSSQFTANETMDERMELVDSFNEGAIDALAAIRCLDEGINIPSIKGAMILSSNDDFREFVQRRGRILRTYKDKKYANIYDIIVLPSYNTPKIAEIEFRRFHEYARLAINKDLLMPQLENLTSEYNLVLEDFITQFDEDKEVNLDD